MPAAAIDTKESTALLCGRSESNTNKKGLYVAKKKHGPGYVYLIHASGTPHYKIGHATDVARRLWQVNHCNPSTCVLIHAMPVDCQSEAEAWWHTFFNDQCVKGEWFALSPKQIELFCRCAGGGIIAIRRQVYKDNRDLFRELMSIES